MSLESSSQTSPTFDKCNPSLIVGDELKARETGPWQFFGLVRAPLTGGPHVLVCRCATPWTVGLPGGSWDPATRTLTIPLENGDVVRNVQVTEIVKAGTSAGIWLVAP